MRAFYWSGGFPLRQEQGTPGMWTRKRDRVAVCFFKGVPAGVYAVAVLDDRNMDGKMDYDMAGIPTKGYGFFQ